jgi:hypothetical protein
MSAAATAAGYLYASGRLRGRGNKDDPRGAPEEHEARAPERKKIRVAALPEMPVAPEAPRPKRAPTIQYRTRRWRPDAG